jgi:hypothetical protein
MRIFLILLAFSQLYVSSAHANWVGGISLEQSRFLSTDYQATEDQAYSFFGFRVKNETGENFKIDFRGQYAVGVPVLSYVDPREFYFSTGGFSFGRKIDSWSLLDESWKMGLFQPVFKWNPLIPDQQGSLGAFYRYQDRQGGFVFFISPVFIPDQGALFEIHDGRFVKSNPWFHAPPSYVRLTPQKAEGVEYNVIKPDLVQIAMRPNLAARAFWGHQDEGPFFQLAQAYGPSHQLGVAVRGAFAIPVHKFQMDILPFVYDRQLSSLDTSWAWENMRVSFSAIRENSGSAKIPDESWTYAEYGPSTLLSPAIHWQQNNFELTGSYLSIEGGEVRARGSASAQTSTVLPSRFMYQHAVSLQGRWEVVMKKQTGFMTSVQWIRGTDQEVFDLIRMNAHYRLNKSWLISSDLMLVKSLSDSGRSDLVNYENNDQLSLGVSYVF